MKCKVLIIKQKEINLPALFVGNKFGIVFTDKLVKTFGNYYDIFFALEDVLPHTVVASSNKNLSNVIIDRKSIKLMIENKLEINYVNLSSIENNVAVVSSYSLDAKIHTI